MSSPHKDEALQSQPTEQVEGSSDPMEQAREVTKQVEMGKASGSCYEQEASDDMEPLEVRKTRRELARDQITIQKPMR